MKSTGIVRLIDELGRVVIPKELRRNLGLNEGDPVEIFVNSETGHIILQGYTGGTCLFCGFLSDNVSYFKGKLVCQDCITDIINAAGLLPTPQVSIIEETTSEVKRTYQETTPKGKRQPRDREALLQQLIDEVILDPSVKQSKLAQRLGISAAYVSNLLKELKQQNNKAFQEASTSKDNA